MWDQDVDYLRGCSFDWKVCYGLSKRNLKVHTPDQTIISINEIYELFAALHLKLENTIFVWLIWLIWSISIIESLLCYQS